MTDCHINAQPCIISTRALMMDVLRNLLSKEIKIVVIIISATGCPLINGLGAKQTKPRVKASVSNLLNDNMNMKRCL